jgi:hypothetical protein
VTRRTPRNRDSGPASLIQARPTVYRGVQMRSRLEADFARQLDEWDLQWTYEPQCFASTEGQYLPDFLVEHKGGRTEYVEVKPASLFDFEDYGGEVVHDEEAYPGAEVDPVLRRMTIIWDSEPEAILHLALWRYEEAFEASIIAINGAWWFTDYLAPPMLWPGMGQFRAIVDKHRDP